MENKALNKEMISELFDNDWYEKYLNDRGRDCKVLANMLEIKIKGVKAPIRVEVYFKEVTQNGLALVDSEVVFSTVNIGDGRQAAIDEALIARLDREEYYLPNWITPNKYVFVEHYTLENYYRYNHHLANFFVSRRQSQSCY